MKLIEFKNNLLPTYNIKQLGFSSFRALGSRFRLGNSGEERSPKIQPFHIVKLLMGTEKPAHLICDAKRGGALRDESRLFEIETISTFYALIHTGST